MKSTNWVRLTLVIPMLALAIPLIAAPPDRRPAQPGIGRVGPGPRDRDSAEKPFTGWNEAEFVFTGKLESVAAGPVGRSYPPMYTHKLSFVVDQVLRGGLTSGDSVGGLRARSGNSRTI